MDWSHDFCLSCDRQSPSGRAYCSQSCRLTDMERASCRSSSSSPQAASSSSWNALPGPSNGFYLPPPLNFHALTGRQTNSSNSSSPTSRSPLSTTPPAVGCHRQSSAGLRPAPYTNQSQSARNSLYSSPSRSSLSSISSAPSTQQQHQQESPVLSDKAKSELRDYASSFDHVRDRKRRMTVV